MEHTTCDECQKMVRTGTGIKITFPYAHLQSGTPANKPLDFCTWVCVETYASAQLPPAL